MPSQIIEHASLSHRFSDVLAYVSPQGLIHCHPELSCGLGMLVLRLHDIIHVQLGTLRVGAHAL